EAATQTPGLSPPVPDSGGSEGAATEGVGTGDADLAGVGADPEPAADGASSGGGGGVGMWLIGWLFCVRLWPRLDAGNGTALAYKTVILTAQYRGRSHAKESDRVAYQTGRHRGGN
ncbi:MAG: hypothetical protein AAF460_13145, partial [Pseudomonadota bacterium]